MNQQKYEKLSNEEERENSLRFFRLFSQESGLPRTASSITCRESRLTKPGWTDKDDEAFRRACRGEAV